MFRGSEVHQPDSPPGCRLLRTRTVCQRSGRNAGDLQRYLAEALWSPHALQRREVTWEAIDDHSARATLSDRGTVVSLVFEFASDHTVTRVWTPARAREVNGTFVPTPWEVSCRDWALRHGTLVPTYCEVSWRLDSGLFTYWKGRIDQRQSTRPVAHPPS